MKIAVWLTDRNIPCFHLSHANHDHLRAKLPNAEITVCSNQDAFLTALPEVEVAIVWTFQQEWISLAPKLRWIATPAAGRDYFAITPPPGLKISYGTFHGEIMAETVLAMMLNQCRGILRTAEAQAKDPWPQSILAPTMTTLNSSHLVILGFGNIGEWIGRLAKPMGVRITGIKQHPGSPPDYFDQHDQIRLQEDLDSILPEADHLALALPRTGKTNHILNQDRLSLLKSSAVIYNVGRGNAIDEVALKRALTDGTLAAAYLDVHATEPLQINHSLKACPNAFLMPHLSAVAPNYLDLYINEFTAMAKAEFS